MLVLVQCLKCVLAVEQPECCNLDWTAFGFLHHCWEFSHRLEVNASLALEYISRVKWCVFGFIFVFWNLARNIFQFLVSSISLKVEKALIQHRESKNTAETYNRCFWFKVMVTTDTDALDITIWKTTDLFSWELSRTNHTGFVML